MKQTSPSMIEISINSILVWLSILIIFVIAMIALFKKTSSGSLSSGGDKCVCDYDEVADAMEAKNFAKNYKTIYPQSIELKKSESDSNSFFKIAGDGNTVTFSGPGDGLTMSFQKETDGQKQGVEIHGDHASMQFNSSDTAHDIARFNNDNNSKCYWYYNYKNESGENCS